MKAVFPCKGVVVLSKKDVNKLEAFYQSTLSTSKLKEIYSTTEYMIQMGTLNYIPPKAKIILKEENLLTTSKLRSVMNDVSIKNTPEIENKKEDSLSDDDILSHPFFTTLKPID